MLMHGRIIFQLTLAARPEGLSEPQATEELSNTEWIYEQLAFPKDMLSKSKHLLFRSTDNL